MHRIYCPAKDITSDLAVLLDSRQIHHIRNVLRLKTKSELVIFDDRDNEYSASIEEIQAQKVILKIKKKTKRSELSRLKISVACAIPKKSKMDEIVDKLTQLGVDRVIPLETERVIVKITGKKRDLRIERWRRVALSACKQSQRKQLPVIEPIKSMSELFAQSVTYDLKLIPTLDGQRKPLKEVLRQAKPKNILVLIGPEGDFTKDELALAEQNSCIPVSLGELTLRVDTACLAAVSFIRLYADG